jgi:hypothetical protein
MLPRVRALVEALERQAAIVPETVVDPPDSDSGYPGGEITHCPACNWVEGEVEHEANYCAAIDARAALRAFREAPPLHEDARLLDILRTHDDGLTEEGGRYLLDDIEHRIFGPRTPAADGEAKPVEPQRCLFDEAWIGRCKEKATSGDMCAKHAGKTCEGCGAAATRSCDHTGQFVCGSPICGTCQHGEVPRDSLFGMGGGHGPRGGTARTGGEAK